MDKSHKKAEKRGGGEYLTQMRMALEHLKEARKYASHSKAGANRLIIRTIRHIEDCEDEA